MDRDRALREQVVALLRGGNAHMGFEEAAADFPERLINERPPHVPYTFWHLIEHLRLCQVDILEYVTRADYRERVWPRDYWPAPDAMATVEEWEAKQKKDVPLLYWTGASWGKAVALSLDRPALAGDFPIVQALVRRALALDEAFNAGAIHEMMITLESLPEDMGGDRQRAAKHYQRAVDLTQGQAAGPHVSYGMGVLLPQQKRTEFVALLTRALEVDVDREPKLRLANILAQQYAQYLLAHLDELFLSDKEGTHDHQH